LLIGRREEIAALSVRSRLDAEVDGAEASELVLKLGVRDHGRCGGGGGGVSGW
jgi:hypothetical protein